MMNSKTKEKIPKKTLRKLKQTFKDTLDNKTDQITAQSYGKWWSRWQKICNGDVDLNNPYVKVEMALCDIRVQKILSNQKISVEERRKQARPYFPDDETFYLYCHGIQPLDPDNTPYTYIETKSMMKHATYNMGEKIRKPFKK